MPIYNLIEYSSNYSETAGRPLFYSKDEATNFDADIANTDEFKFFKYKTKLLGNTVVQPASNATNRILKNPTIAVPLIYLGNFWRSLQMLLINFKVELKRKCTKYCVLSAANVNGNATDNVIIFTIKDTKLYILVVT